MAKGRGVAVDLRKRSIFFLTANRLFNFHSSLRVGYLKKKKKLEIVFIGMGGGRGVISKNAIFSTTILFF